MLSERERYQLCLYLSNISYSAIVNAGINIGVPAL